MDKQKVIQQAYIDLLNAEKFFNLEHSIDQNGWCTMFDERGQKVTPVFRELGFNEDPAGVSVDTSMKEGCMVWRPKALSGLDHNNGWFRIEESLPISNGHYFMAKPSGITMVEIDNLKKTNELKEAFLKDGFTHWQPIVIPKAPIY